MNTPMNTNNATILREYFKTGHHHGRHARLVTLVEFASEYTSYITAGHIPPGFGKHRLTRNDYVLAAGRAT